MKHAVSLPALVAHAAQDTISADDPRSIHARFITTSFVLSFLLWPVGVAMGLVYLGHARWRAAGATMLAIGLIAGLVSTLVLLSIS